jgi:hypothetical protein
MSLGYLPTPCDIHVFFTLSHGDSLQTPFDLSFPTPSPPLEMDTVSVGLGHGSLPGCGAFGLLGRHVPRT